MLATEVVEVAQAHRLRQQQLAAVTAREAARLWGFVDPQAVRASWGSLVRRLLQIVMAAQTSAVRGSQDYVTVTLKRQGGTPNPYGTVNASGLIGVTSDGRDLEGLLFHPAITVENLVDGGLDRTVALDRGLTSAKRIVATQIQDAARVSTGLAVYNDRDIGWWVRMLQPPSCARCVILAGKRFRYNKGFARHPNCFPAGVTVSGPANLAASRRWYEGELFVIRTASGQELPATGNHPILTDRGWLPANLIQEGDYVVRSTRGQGATALVVPDEDQVPTLIEDCWRPNRMMPLLQMPTTAEDFHGDGGHGEVDVVLLDRLLRDGVQSSLGQLSEYEEFARGIAESFSFAGLSPSDQLVERLLSSTHSVMGSSSLGLALAGSHATGADFACGGPVADGYPDTLKANSNDIAADFIALAEAVFALASPVGGANFVDRKFDVSTRWDAPAGAFTMESRVAYAAQGKDLLERLAGQVELDRVVKSGGIQWSGHVYNLTSAEGWYSANGLIVSNCDCIHIPLSESGDTFSEPFLNPYRYLESVSRAEAERILGKAGARAVLDDGADVGQVVNARSGMQVASPFGRPTLVTSAGTTRRGFAGQRLGVRRGRRVVRLMPESIYQDAERLGWSREETLAMLKRHGYID